MNLKALIASLIIGSSSAAMAAPSMRAHATWNTSVSVRDHRVATAQSQRGYDERFNTPVRTQVEQPSLQDCSNWDPTTGSSNCGPASRVGTRVELPWTSLGSRDASISDHQYVTVEQQFRQLRLEPASGRPLISKVGIRYMDGSVQLVQVSAPGCAEELRRQTVIDLQRKEISQVVVYTNQGSFGTYSLYAV